MHDFYEIGRQANFQGFFNEKPQKIAYLKKIFALPLGLLGLATDNDSWSRIAYQSRLEE